MGIILQTRIFNVKLSAVKRLPLIITLTLAVGLAGLYFFYARYYKLDSIKVWDLVPQEAILVYEPGNCISCVDLAEKSPFWQVAKKTSLHAKPIESVKEIDNLFKTMSFALVSLHPIKKDDFDFVFYGSTKSKQTLQLDSGIQNMKANKQAKFSSREFNSVQINEISIGNHIFSWAVIKNVWVASFTPFLVEDVVRTYESDSRGAFKSKLGSNQAKIVKSETGNLYINLPNFSKWLSVFTEQELPFMLNNLGKSTILDSKIDDKSIVLNGLSSDSANQSFYSLSVFEKQSPVPLSLKQLISNRTAILVSYGVSDGIKFSESIRSFSNTHRTELNDTIDKLSKELNIQIEPLREGIKGEVGISYLETREKKLSKVLMIQTGEPERWLKTLGMLSEKFSADTIFVERFSEYEIRELALYNFPEKILWPLATGFKTSFYTSIGNTILIAEDIEELKKCLDDIDREETWGKSVSQNQFLETTLLEANLSVYINTPKIWNTLSARLRPEWVQFIQENRSLLNSIRMGAIQFSHLNESYYTNLTWANGRYSSKRSETVVSKGERTMTNFSSAIYKAFVVESHVSKDDQILVQDSSYRLNLISTDGKVLWGISLGQPIVGRIHQIDYFKNNKLQYLFATTSTLYLIDRLGNPVEPFPLQLKIRDAEHLSVIDYDHSKKYRFLVSGKSGKLWMYDKEGNALDGWRPNTTEGSLLIAARHHRIKGKDYVIAIRTDGIVYLMNRRGELYKKFPLNLETRLSGNYFLEIGNSMSTTYFVVVAKEGFKIKFNLEGKILSRETLIKTSIDAQFGLVCDDSRRSYIVVRQENKQLSLFDESGKEILKNEYIGLHRASIEYFDFGSGNVYYALTDLQENLSFIYGNKGNLITSPPVESHWIGVRQGDGDNLSVFGTLDKTLTIQQTP